MYTFLSVSLRIRAEHLLSYGNEVSYTIINARCQVSCKAPGILYVILSEPPEKTSTEFYIIRKISELTFLYFKQKRYDFVRLYGPLNRTVFFKVTLRTLS